MAMKKTTKDVGNDDEQIGGKGVSLAQPFFAVDPTPRQAIEKDCRLPSG
jgi:hypothetical protein